MKRATPVVAVVAFLTLGVATAGADTTAPLVPANPSDPLALTCDGQSVRLHVRKAKRVISRAYDPNGGGWKDAHPFSKRDAARVRQHKRCISATARSARREIGKWREAKLRHFNHVRKRKLAAQDDGGGSWCAPENMRYPGSSCWVVPDYIIACESRGSWSAYNPSGAVGPYQLLGHGAPFPVSNRAQAMQHHRIAASLSLSAWVCA